MARKARMSKGKTMKPNFFVFCEGETEVTYIKYLRSLYHVPIQIIPKKSDSNISGKYIENCKRDYVTTKNDVTFLMFDLDVDGMLGRLQKIKDAILLVSNPCIELWFLLHYDYYCSALDTSVCIDRLLEKSAKYKKGVLLPCEKEVLAHKIDEAVKRAKRLGVYINPSTTIYRLIELIENYDT